MEAKTTFGPYTTRGRFQKEIRIEVTGTYFVVFEDGNEVFSKSFQLPTTAQIFADTCLRQQYPLKRIKDGAIALG